MFVDLCVLNYNCIKFLTIYYRLQTEYGKYSGLSLWYENVKTGLVFVNDKNLILS